MGFMLASLSMARLGVWLRMRDSERLLELEQKIDSLETRIEEIASRLAWLLECSP